MRKCMNCNHLGGGERYKHCKLSLKINSLEGETDCQEHRYFDNNEWMKEKSRMAHIYIEMEKRRYER